MHNIFSATQVEKVEKLNAIGSQSGVSTFLVVVAVVGRSHRIVIIRRIGALLLIRCVHHVRLSYVYASAPNRDFPVYSCVCVWVLAQFSLRNFFVVRVCCVFYVCVFACVRVRACVHN